MPPRAKKPVSSPLGEPVCSVVPRRQRFVDLMKASSIFRLKRVLTNPFICIGLNASMESGVGRELCDSDAFIVAAGCFIDQQHRQKGYNFPLKDKFSYSSSLRNSKLCSIDLAA
jgi:hypothetical protein